MQYKKATELVLAAYRDDGDEKFYLPSSLSDTDIDQIFLRYMNGERPNLNYLQEIIETEIPVAPKTKLRAKRRYQEGVNKLFENDTGPLFTTETSVSFAPNQSEVKAVNCHDHRIVFVYDLDWIRDNLDFPTLLNNFIYLFEFADFQMRLSHVSKKVDISAIERSLWLKSSKRRYETGCVFEQMEAAAQLQTYAYYKCLKDNGIMLEDAIQWFFSEYLSNEFGATRFRVSMPSGGTGYAEKCTLIVAAIDSAIRQFSYMVEDGEIDFELLQMTSAPRKYDQIPSFVADKYAYGSGERYEKATTLLFSDQCPLRFLVKTEDSYKNFAELVKRSKVYIDDYHDRWRDYILWLEKEGFVWVGEDGQVKLQNEAAIEVLNQLYRFEVLSVINCSPMLRNAVAKLAEKGYIEYGSTLLSRPEVDLFDYYMNRARFVNGYDLRNKYAHGVQQTEEDEKVHQNNYIIILRLFISLIIKMNDDFCAREWVKKLY